MAVTVLEKALSRELVDAVDGASDTAELLYTIGATGADIEDDAAVLSALKSTAPTTHNGLSRLRCGIEPLGAGRWDGSAQYGRPDSQAEDASTYSFDTAGGSLRITQAKAHVNTYAPAGETGPDFKGAIGVTDDGNIEGCDITVPVFNFTETHYIADAKVTAAYKGRLFKLTGKTNSAAWGGFEIGEVLFCGAAGTRREDGVWEVTFKFAAQPNVTGQTIGTITGIDKKGWEYLWVLYEKVEDAVAIPPRIVKRPAAVYIERVYDEDAFAKLDPDWTEP